MIRALDVYKALLEAVRKVLPKVTVAPREKLEATTRPCIYLEFAGLREGRAAVLLRSSNINCRLFYFAPQRSKGYGDLLEKQAILMELLDKPLLVQDGFFVSVADTVGFTVSLDDMALVADFDLYMAQAMATGYEGLPDMGALETRFRRDRI